MATVILGSAAPKAPEAGVQTTVNGEEVKSDEQVTLPAKTAVLIDTPDFDAEGAKIPLDKKLMEIRVAFALHSEKPAEWVEGADEGFTGAVSQVFDCSIGRPDDWDDNPEQPSENIEGDEGVVS